MCCSFCVACLSISFVWNNYRYDVSKSRAFRSRCLCLICQPARQYPNTLSKFDNLPINSTIV